MVKQSSFIARLVLTLDYSNYRVRIIRTCDDPPIYKAEIYFKRLGSLTYNTTIDIQGASGLVVLYAALDHMTNKVGDVSFTVKFTDTWEGE